MIANVAVASGLLTGCAATTSPVAEWAKFTATVDAASPSELIEVREDVLRDYNSKPRDDARLRLSYVLSRPSVATQDLTRSRALLEEMAGNGRYAPLRALASHEIDLVIELQAAHERIRLLQSQLEALKAIEADLATGRDDGTESGP